MYVKTILSPAFAVMSETVIVVNHESFERTVGSVEETSFVTNTFATASVAFVTASVTASIIEPKKLVSVVGSLDSSVHTSAAGAGSSTVSVV